MSAFLVIVITVIVWIGILCLLVKLDIGGFGSNVLAPVLKDVPVLNKILPSESVVSTDDEEAYGGYTRLLTISESWNWSWHRHSPQAIWIRRRWRGFARKWIG